MGMLRNKGGCPYRYALQKIFSNFLVEELLRNAEFVASHKDLFLLGLPLDVTITSKIAT